MAAAASCCSGESAELYAGVATIGLPLIASRLWHKGIRTCACGSMAHLNNGRGFGNARSIHSKLT